MPVTAQSADGVLHEFPDGTDQSVIDRAMKKYASESPEANDPYESKSLEDIKKLYHGARMLGAEQKTLSNLADAYVFKEQQQGGFGLALDDTVRQVARGVPIVGGALDEASAYLNSLGGGDYQENLDYQRARDRFVEKHLPGLTLTEQIIGGIGSGVGAAKLLGAGGGAANAARALPTAGEATTAALTGSGIGAADMFARGEGENRVGNAAIGAVAGGVLGAAAPYLSAAISTGTQKVLDLLSSNEVLQKLGISRNAANVLIRQLSSDDTLTQTGAQRIRSAGPEAMLADAGPAATNLLDTSLQRSGPGATAARDAIEARARQANQGRAKERYDRRLLTRAVKLTQRPMIIQSIIRTSRAKR
jgi:hypothetical protein